ncbi:uncharacterized protein HMPREF1541_09066 [Cyphellophora europaea CBS 101466]|uniref:Autophagy-related protein n=1 Tax=Cyphellophora europaea (strain CBS 101466) TaxID=1220924 RepID=W2RM57_CYPE1|nr:uncharacterized protein HMPREF1541_09066 [Cyphellophora europaea CBS 101466]ETN36788.1 hypothetical protein HMPREF1541_09066 [Cyphellophora europaea CBS 101466]
MSVFGMVANGVGGIVVYVVVIVLSVTLSGTAAQSSGLLVSTIVGFITVAGAAVAYYGLPAIPSRPASQLEGWSRPLIEFFMPFKDLLTRKNMAAILVSYTIYTDSTFAVSSVISQLFIAEVRPSTLEFSLYSLAQSLFLMGCTLAFLWIRPYFRMGLEMWLLIGYALILVIPVWACIGFSSANFGFKNRWEFYVQLFIFQTSGSLVNASFRVLFSEMIPVGSEIRWFGMQLVLSCATVWVNYVASGPLQNVTHQLRFPLVISLIFLVFALSVESCRVTLPTFQADLRKWHDLDHGTATSGRRDEEIDKIPGRHDHAMTEKSLQQL